MKITVELISPLMVGSKMLNNNYRKSLTYIPGSVLRAAYAQAVFDRCCYGDLDKNKRCWVSFQNKEECVNCKVSELCKQFSDITFPTLYPFGSEPFLNTAKICKYPSNTCKSPIDTLTHKNQTTCSCGASYEKALGFHIKGNKRDVPTHPTTKTSISPYLRKADEASLFALETVSPETVSPESVSGDEPIKFIPTTFSGHIECNTSVFSDILTIRVGGYTTSGFGKCSVKYEKDDEIETENKLLERVNRFNALYPHEDNERYITIDLLTNAYLKLEEISAENMSKWEDMHYLKYLEEKIALPDCYTLIDAIKTQETHRGWDTSSTKEKTTKCTYCRYGRCCFRF